MSVVSGLDGVLRYLDGLLSTSGTSIAITVAPSRAKILGVQASEFDRNPIKPLDERIGSRWASYVREMVTRPESAKQIVLRVCGEMLSELFRIIDGSIGLAPNAPGYARRKDAQYGHHKPLIASGKMLMSFRVRPEG